MESQSHHCSKLDFNNNGNAQVKARALSALATLYQAQSKYSAAIKLHEPQAVMLACGIIKPNDKSPNLCLADSVTGYAEALQKSGDLAGAETYHREALKTQTRAIEEDLCTDPELAISYTQLGCTLSEMEDFEESHKLHTLALKLWYKHLDIYHGLVSESLSYCAESLCKIDLRPWRRCNPSGISLCTNKERCLRRKSSCICSCNECTGIMLSCC
jgi:tetratricopeptide (TPR) repeat protein